MDETGKPLDFLGSSHQDLCRLELPCIRWRCHALHDRSVALLPGKRRNADDRSVSAQQQRIDEHRDGPAPEPDLTGDEPVPPGRDGGEGNDRGLHRKGLPGGGAQEPPALGVDRHGASQGDDGPGREKQERRRIAIADEMHQRPDPDPDQERMTRDPDDPLRRLPDAAFLGDRGRIRCRQADDDEQHRRDHQDDGDRLPPLEHAPNAQIRRPIIGRDEPPDADERRDREAGPVAVFAQYRDRAVAQHGAGDAEMDPDEEQRGQDH